MINKVRYAACGYRSPRDFSSADIARAAAYDFSVVDGWLEHLAAYTDTVDGAAGKTVLELGPGPDLGTGLILLAMGAMGYAAIDIGDLAKGAPDALYDELLRQIAKRPDISADIDALRADITALRSGSSGRLDYRCRKDFDISTIAADSVDVVFSHAAFEHFDDVDAVAKQVHQVARDGAVLIARIDLRTHTRWLRQRDPLNIYRYSTRAYEMMKFRGSPNRLRTGDYAAAFDEAGWTDIRLWPLSVLPDEYVVRVCPSLAEPFRSPTARMEVLSLVLCARK